MRRRLAQWAWKLWRWLEPVTDLDRAAAHLVATADEKLSAARATYRRQWVFHRLTRAHPEATKRAVSLAIEYALEKVRPS